MILKHMHAPCRIEWVPFGAPGSIYAGMAVMLTVVVASRSRLDPEKSGVNIKKGNKAAK